MTGLLADGAERAADGDEQWLAATLDRLHSGLVADLFPVADEIVARLTAHEPGDTPFRRWLAHSVGGLQATSPEILSRLNGIGLPIITTNYDTLIEDARGGRFVTWQQQAAVEKVLRGDDEAVIHLHGVWSEPDSVVLNMHSYLRKQDHPIREIQRAAAALNSFIFVGVGEGSRDPDMGPLIEWLSSVSRNSEYTHYRLCRSSELEALRGQHNYHNVELVPYGDEHAALPGFLALLESPETIKLAPYADAERPTPRLADLDNDLLRLYSESQPEAITEIDEEALAVLHLADDAGEMVGLDRPVFARSPSMFFPGSTIKIVDIESKRTLSVDGPVARQLTECMTALRNLVAMPHLSPVEPEDFFSVVRKSCPTPSRTATTGQPNRSWWPGHLPRSGRTSPGRLRTRPSQDHLLGKSQPPHPHRARVLHYLGTAEGAGLGDLALREFRTAILRNHPSSDVRVAEEQGQVVVTLRVPPPEYGTHADMAAVSSEQDRADPQAPASMAEPDTEPIPRDTQATMSVHDLAAEPANQPDSPVAPVEPPRPDARDQAPAPDSRAERPRVCPVTSRSRPRKCWLESCRSNPSTDPKDGDAHTGTPRNDPLRRRCRNALCAL